MLFDGCGREVDGRIRSVSDVSLEVEVTGNVRKKSGSRSALTLVVATPKGARADWLVEKTAELGVNALWWLTTERGTVTPGEGKLARWRRKAAAAAKQAGRAWIMNVEPPRTIAEVMQYLDKNKYILYGDLKSESRPLVEILSELREKKASSSAPEEEILVFIGPEGGFSSDEHEEIERVGGKPVRLADSVLRVETAAIAVASICACSAESDKFKERPEIPPPSLGVDEDEYESSR